MVFKLAKNAKKGRWEGGKITEYVAKLEGEVAELKESIPGRNTMDIILEAADIANFAMIVAAMAMDGGAE